MPLHVCLKHRWAVIFLLIMALSPKCRLAIWQRLQIQKNRSKFCNSDPFKIVLVIEREYLKTKQEVRKMKRIDILSQHYIIPI